MLQDHAIQLEECWSYLPKLVNKIFAEQLGKSMEVYVDDILVKSLQSNEHIQHLEQTFQILGKFRMRLNPTKYAFGVASGKFLGFMVHHRGIEVNSEKIHTLLDISLRPRVKAFNV